MELRQLRYFVAVGEELHFRRAATRLHMSQPPLSQQIRRLEEEMGCRLLIRTRRRVELTPAGEAFLRDAQQLLAGLEGAVGAARRIQAGQTGRLRIGFVGSALLSIVPEIVRWFGAQRPDVELELRERSTVEQTQGLAERSLDVGFLRPPLGDDGLRIDTLLRERVVAALPREHPLARSRRIALRRLADEPFILFPRAQAPGFHDSLVAGLTATGTVPRVVQEAPEMQTIIGLVAAGIGISVVPASVERLTLAGVTYRPVTGAPRAELATATRPDDDSSLVRAFVALTRDVATRGRVSPHP